MNKYNHQKIEKKWQKKWEKNQLDKAVDNNKKPKFYGLIEFPYPSGEGLHVGHIRSNTAMDIICRKRRMQGYNVLYPIGWDAFGLPTENYAIKTGIHPIKVTKKNTDTFRRQLKELGFSFDWNREINTTDPAYYKWTQWIFLQFLKNGLAYKKKMAINWCPSCKIGLANEEVVDGNCERCGALTEKKEKDQWMLAITKYADRLDKDLDQVDYLEKIKIQQRNWIGRSEGAEVEFRITNYELRIKVFTTRPDTLFGATFMVISPEHELVKNLKGEIKNWSEVEKYLNEAKNKSDLERTDLNKEKTGVKLDGVMAINPVNNEEIPIFVADYVMMGYGTGAIMAVPAHDERDFEFAKKYELKITEVVKGGEDVRKEVFAGGGLSVNSDFLNGLETEVAKEKIINWLEEKKLGKRAVNYKLRDWVFSRQHYWGEPIPVVHCEKCGQVPVPEKDLPVELPKVEKYQPTDTGESPLAAITEWVNTKCPLCGGKAKRETDTMPNWAGSSWYYLRYADSNNKKVFADFKKLEYWTPVDWYNGGMEHTTLHLLYSRFWHKFLFDLALVPTSEPYTKRTSHGLILAEGGVKMSKSKGNVINPDEIVKVFGADALRIYEMFMGPFDQSIAWGTDGINGTRRFLENVYKLKDKELYDCKGGDCKIKELGLPNVLHKTIKKVSEDIENMRFNTAISQMMIFVNFASKFDKLPRGAFEIFLKLLAPFAPHIAEELWSEIKSPLPRSAERSRRSPFIKGGSNSIFKETWPEYNEAMVKDESINLVIQINGKVRDTVEVLADISEEEAKEIALKSEKIKKWLEGKEVKKIIFIKGKLINIVV